MTTSPASKESKAAKSRSKPVQPAHGVALPLVVDPTSLNVMDVERVDSERGDQLIVHISQPVGATGSHTHKKKGAASRPAGTLLIYELEARDTTRSRKPARAIEDVAPNLNEVLIRSVFEKTLESVREVRQHQAGELTTDQFIRQVAETLADKANVGAAEPPVEQGWQSLLESGLRSKTSLLRSPEFKTTSEAGELLGIQEPAVRRRIREHKLFALKTPIEGEHRIPAWALDPGLAGGPTATLLSEAGAADEWYIYHFLTTPNGSLNGLRPFECLMSREHLPLPRQALRDELAAYLGLSLGAPLLDAVKQALVAELMEGQQA